MKTSTIFSVVVAAILLTGSAAGAKTLVLCYPGGNVRESDAKPATDQMLRVMERMAGWPANSFTSEFTSDMTKCSALMAKAPDYAIVSLGYLMANPNGLIPVVQPRVDGKTSETFRVLVRKGTFKALEDLKGKKIGGTPLAEPAFVEKLIFEGKLPLSACSVEKARGSMKVLRDLSDGKIDAALVTDQQYAGSKALAWAKDFEVVYTSRALPLMPLVASKSKTSESDRADFIKTMEKFCSDKDGKQFCQLFGIAGFVKAADKDFNEARTLWK